jgi:hypothetical protein
MGAGLRAATSFALACGCKLRESNAASAASTPMSDAGSELPPRPKAMASIGLCRLGKDGMLVSQ